MTTREELRVLANILEREGCIVLFPEDEDIGVLFYKTLKKQCSRLLAYTKRDLQRLLEIIKTENLDLKDAECLGTYYREQEWAQRMQYLTLRYICDNYQRDLPQAQYLYKRTNSTKSIQEFGL